MAIIADGFDIEAIRRINNTVVNDDGTIKSFKEQLLEYEYGYYNAFLPFVLTPDFRAIAQSGAENYPIIMNANVLAKLKQKHDLLPMEIAELPRMIAENNAIMMDSYTFYPGGLVMYLDDQGSHDASLFVAFHLDEKSGEVFVNRLASVYERANIEHTITQTWEKGLRIYPNSKTKDWLKSFGLQLPDNLASLLDGNYRSVSKAERIPNEDIIAGQTANCNDKNRPTLCVSEGFRRRFPKDCVTIGIYNEWSGCGGMLEIEPGRDVVLPVSMVRDFQIEGQPKTVGSWMVDQTYGGLIDECW